MGGLFNPHLTDPKIETELGDLRSRLANVQFELEKQRRETTKWQLISLVLGVTPANININPWSLLWSVWHNNKSFGLPEKFRKQE
jgi:hypothetical protein